jgi:molecular chaperone IbpA
MDYNKAVTDMFKRGEEVIDNFWNVLEHNEFPFLTLTSTTNGFRNFPVYNIIEDKDGNVRLEMAIAGYAKDQVKVEKEGNTLIIQGNKCVATENEVYRHKGISSAAFLRTFDLKVGVEIGDVQLKDGILTVGVISSKPVQPPRTTFEIK